MNLLSKVFWAMCALTACSVSADAQVTNVAERTTAALTEYGAVPTTTVTQVPRQVTVCHSNREGGFCVDGTVYDSVSKTTSGVLTASNIRIVKVGDLTFGDKVKHDLTDHVSVDDNLAQNCSSQAASQTFTLTIAFQQTAQVTFTQSTTNTLSYAQNYSLKLSDNLTVGGVLTFGVQETSGTANATGTSSTITKTRTGTQPVAAKTFLMLELQVWPVQYTVPFTTTVTVDGDLSPNDKNLHKLSDILDETKRTFPIVGTIEADDASDGVLRFWDVPFDASQCPSAPVHTALLKKFKPAQGTKLLAVPAK